MNAEHGPNPAHLSEIGLPPIDQVGFVVADLDESIRRYDPLFGPFHRMDGSVQGADYRGRVEDVVLELAFGRSGTLEIELIQWKSGHSPHREFIEQGREGLHHLRYRVDDCASWTARLQALGYRAIWGKDMQIPSGRAVWSYLERPGDPLIVELLQMP